jgi:hypothetical protein
MADHRKDMIENLAHGPVIALRGFCDVETDSNSTEECSHSLSDQIGILNIELNFSKDLSNSLTALETLDVNKTILEHVRCGLM